MLTNDILATSDCDTDSRKNLTSKLSKYSATVKYAESEPTGMAIETILLAVGAGDTDRLDRLAEETIDVAGPTGATVVIGHVFTKNEYNDALDNLDFDVTAEEVSGDDVARRHATVRDIVRKLEEADVDYIVRGAVGDYADELVDLAKDIDADRLLVGGRKRSPAGKAVFGSLAQEVMLESPCPVTFVRADTK